MPDKLEHALARWRGAGLIEPAQLDRILEFERVRSGSGVRWPVAVALAAGGLMLCAGVLLFVAAHWDQISPPGRFALLFAMVLGFHAIAVAAADRFEALAVTLHTAGTVALGAGIFLAGQIFNLAVHWPEGFLLWALGAWAAWLLRRDWPQLALAALLTPLWLASEWIDFTDGTVRGAPAVPIAGALLLAVAYLLAPARDRRSAGRTALAWIGGITLMPLAIATIFAASDLARGAAAPSVPLAMVGWALALGIPLVVGWALRVRAILPLVIAAVWVWWGIHLGSRAGVLPYVWTAIGSLGLASLGWREGNRQLINLGVAGFALTVLVFYFSNVLSQLDRARSLIVGGVVFLVGGWLLEKFRRRLIARLAQAEAA